MDILGDGSLSGCSGEAEAASTPIPDRLLALPLLTPVPPTSDKSDVPADPVVAAMDSEVTVVVAIAALLVPL